MPGFTVTVPHKLDNVEARTRIQKLVGELQKQYAGMIQNLKEKWSDNGGEFSFDAMGFSVKGNLFIEPGQIRVDGSLPLAALPFKGRIEEGIRTKAAELLA